jgi:DNA-damage-inducible protein J
MAQVMVNFRMDEDLKKNMEQTCKDMGLTLTSAFTMFATKVAREKRIPFDVVADPFYNRDNIERLEKAIEDVKAGRSTLKEHELIEEDE